jgi:hypothetical protein
MQQLTVQQLTGRGGNAEISHRWKGNHVEFAIRLVITTVTAILSMRGSLLSGQDRAMHLAAGKFFRSGYLWDVGKGHFFYFCPGDQDYSIYRDEHILKTLGDTYVWSRITK